MVVVLSFILWMVVSSSKGQGGVICGPGTLKDIYYISQNVSGKNRARIWTILDQYYINIICKAPC